MKKVIIWFCGTGTNAFEMTHLIQQAPNNGAVLPQQQPPQLPLDSFDMAIIIDGVGTHTNYSKAERLTKKDKSWVAWFCSWFTGSALLYDAITGYKERENIVSIEQVFTLLDYLEQLDDTEEVQLTIGGHSRGAAVGMVTFLASLHEIATYPDAVEANSCWQRVKKVRLIAVDPVAGAQNGQENTNDMLGLPAGFGMSDLLQGLEARLFDHRPLFELWIYSARFDPRTLFRFDARWFDMIEAKLNGPANDPLLERTHLVSAGFRHSAMIMASDELSQLYGNPALGPIALLSKIITDKPRQEILALADRLGELEIALIDAMRAEQEQTPLLKLLKHKTALNSYGVGSIVMKGEDLETILQRLDPQIDPAEIQINRRYLFQTRH